MLRAALAAGSRCAGQHWKMGLQWMPLADLHVSAAVLGLALSANAPAVRRQDRQLSVMLINDATLHATHTAGYGRKAGSTYL